MDRVVDLPFVLECETKEQANKVDLVHYRFEKFSDMRNCYIFVLRAKR